MPKVRKTPPRFTRSGATPLGTSAKNTQKNKDKNLSQSTGTGDDEKEWKEARCPICMDPPHNAVLLLCSSHDKGCRPYMCDNAGLSNCLHRFLTSIETTPFSCPLCRGKIKEWEVIEEPAREFMDSVSRYCSFGSCEVYETHAELEKHARVEHLSMVQPLEKVAAEFRRTARIRVGRYPTHQLADRTYY